MNKSHCYDANLITDDGYYAPFVAVIDGTYYVGDCDNLDSFSTVEAAISHCNEQILAGDALAKAKRHHDDDCRDNYAAEYRWHRDALLQIEALRNCEAMRAFKAGATHAEVMAANEAGVDMWGYARARDAGATHKGILAAHAAGVNVWGYASAREAGTTHDEVMAAHAAGVNPGYYALARKAGATHKEILAAHAAGVDMWGYASAREAGSHPRRRTE